MKKRVIKLEDIDDVGCNIKWRMTDLCQARCSYCARARKRAPLSSGKKETEHLIHVAEILNAKIEESKFEKIKIEFIGGECTCLDLFKIIPHLTSKKISRIHMTSNMLVNTEYYIKYVNMLHAKGIKASITASFHDECIVLPYYIQKMCTLKDYFDIYNCETVSTVGTQDIVKEFIEECEKNNLYYFVDQDIKLSKEKYRKEQSFYVKNNKFPVCKYRYKATFDDGTTKLYETRNSFITDTDLSEVIDLNRFASAGMLCTYGVNYIYLEVDKIAYGGTKRFKDSLCGGRIPIESWKGFTETPIKCQGYCTLCGRVSLYRP